MGFFSRIIGITGSWLQYGGPSGPSFGTPDGVNLAAENANQTGYVNVRGADPVESNDLVTLEYFNAHSSSSSSTVPQTASSTGFTVAVNTQVLFFTDIKLTAGATGDLIVNGLLQGIH